MLCPYLGGARESARLAHRGLISFFRSLDRLSGSSSVTWASAWHPRLASGPRSSFYTHWRAITRSETLFRRSARPSWWRMVTTTIIDVYLVLVWSPSGVPRRSSRATHLLRGGRISVLSRWGSFGALSDVPEKSLGNNSLIGSKRRDFTYVVMKYDGYQTTSIGLTTQQPERATCFPNVPVNWDTIEDTCGNSDDKGIADVNGDRFNSKPSRGTSISSYGTTIYDTELVQGAPEPFRLWAAEEGDVADKTDDFISKFDVPATIALQKMHAPSNLGLRILQSILQNVGLPTPWCLPPLNMVWFLVCMMWSLHA